MKIKSIIAIAALAAITLTFAGAATADTPCCETCCDTCYNDCCEMCCSPPPGCYHERCLAARRAARQAAYQQCVDAWYGTYSHVGWGSPVTLVVPPTARYQTDYGWGVGNTRVSPIYPQFSRQAYGAAGYHGSGAYRATPLWPSDTTQFGVYYARGPW